MKVRLPPAELLHQYQQLIVVYANFDTMVPSKRTISLSIQYHRLKINTRVHCYIGRRRPKYEGKVRLPPAEMIRQYQQLIVVYANFVTMVPSSRAISLSFQYHRLKIDTRVYCYIGRRRPKYEGPITNGGDATSILVVDCCLCQFRHHGTFKSCYLLEFSISSLEN